ncbi:hypothetical protein KIW84_058247 [Lathyrus oleraceus]|nr:hypothetical protein KIW84_058247 [Pisum sativum]
MATLNVFSQTLHPTISSSFCSSSSSYSNSNYGSFCPNSNTSKFHFFSNSSSLSAPTLSNSSKTLFTKSGSGGSWLQSSSASVSNEQKNGPVYSVFPSSPAQVSSVQDLYKFICSGPLLDRIGLTPENVAESIDKWLTYGRQLCRLFQLNELFLTEPQKVRLYHYYIPVFLWCESEIVQHRSKFKDGEDIPPLVIGFSAPQGCGKTTLVFALDYLFQMIGR